jgi:hypothetical protein
MLYEGRKFETYKLIVPCFFMKFEGVSPICDTFVENYQCVVLVDAIKMS